MYRKRFSTDPRVPIGIKLTKKIKSNKCDAGEVEWWTTPRLTVLKLKMHWQTSICIKRSKNSARNWHMVSGPCAINKSSFLKSMRYDFFTVLKLITVLCHVCSAQTYMKIRWIWRIVLVIWCWSKYSTDIATNTISII